MFTNRIIWDRAQKYVYNLYNRKIKCLKDVKCCYKGRRPFATLFLEDSPDHKQSVVFF